MDKNEVLFCPLCGTRLKLSQRVGVDVECDHCGEFEVVVEVSPIQPDGVEIAPPEPAVIPPPEPVRSSRKRRRDPRVTRGA